MRRFSFLFLFASLLHGVGAIAGITDSQTSMGIIMHPTPAGPPPTPAAATSFPNEEMCKRVRAAVKKDFRGDGKEPGKLIQSVKEHIGRAHEAEDNIDLLQKRIDSENNNQASKDSLGQYKIALIQEKTAFCGAMNKAIWSKSAFGAVLEHSNCPDAQSLNQKMTEALMGKSDRGNTFSKEWMIAKCTGKE